MENVLTSANNPQVKLLRRLARSAKERREANLYIAEGTHVTESFLASGQIPQTYIVAVSAQKNHEVAELIEELGATSAQKLIISDSIFDTISSVHASSGICIVFSPPQLASRNPLPLRENTVLLEDVQDPGNMGTILRTAAAVGIKQILLSAACTSPWSPKALRAGMGAQFSLDIYEDVDLTVAMQTSEIMTVATVLDGDSSSLYDIDLKQPVAWLFGSEGQGLSKTLASLTKIKATIPQEKNTVESLNVAAAATVCLYEQYRQKIQ